MDFTSRIFKRLPESLAAMTAEDLASSLAEYRSLVKRLASNDAELAPPEKFSAEDIERELEFAVEQIKRIEGEQTILAAAEQTFNQRMADFAAQAGVELTAEGEGTEDAAAGEGETAAEGAEGAEGEAAAEGTEGAAAEGDAAELTAEGAGAETAAVEETVAAVVPSRRPIARKQTERTEPVVVDEGPMRGAPLVASAGLGADGFNMGDELDRLGLARAIQAAARRNTAAAGTRVEVVVASATWDAPNERRLIDGDYEGNAAKIEAAVGRDAQVEFAAAGNVLCAPLTPIYDLPQISTRDEPIWNGNPAFQAERGGITWGTPPSIADVTTAIGIITAEDEEAGGTFATKTCQLLECDEFNSAEVASIFHCLLWGNLGSRAWPERVAQFTDVVMAAWSRLAEENLLNLMAAGSTQVSAAQATYGYGALSNLTSQILVAAAGYRSRFRMSQDARFVGVFPAWVRDLILSDLINAQFDRFAIEGHAGVDAFIRSKGIEPIWYLDEQTNGGQIFAAQGATALLEFPLDVKWFLYPIGTWVGLDTGSLELGIVRDSTLNAENEYQVFGESWRSIAQVGYQSLEITSELCPSGATGGPATIITCT